MVILGNNAAKSYLKQGTCGKFSFQLESCNIFMKKKKKIIIIKERKTKKDIDSCCKDRKM